MPPLAHHTAEDTLAPLLVLGGSGLSVVAAIGRERLAAARAWLARKQALPADAGMQAREPPGRPRPASR
jgi:hypothetical protein